MLRKIPLLVLSVSASSFSHRTLRDDLDAISPGSADWFFQWGAEQATLDTVGRIMDGDMSVDWSDIVPNFRIQPAVITYAILARNPEINPERFRAELAHQCNRFNIPHNIHSIDNLYNAATLYTTMPSSVYEIMRELQSRENFTIADSLNELLSIIRNNPIWSNTITFGNEVISQKQTDVRLRTKLTFWFLFCVRDPSSVVPTANDTVSATSDAKFAIYEHMLLVVLKKRSSTGRML